nr:uncharacterized protein LOC123763799 [Procambarus clarkii]
MNVLVFTVLLVAFTAAEHHKRNAEPFFGWSSRSREHTRPNSYYYRAPRPQNVGFGMRIGVGGTGGIPVFGTRSNIGYGIRRGSREFRRRHREAEPEDGYDFRQFL